MQFRKVLSALCILVLLTACTVVEDETDTADQEAYDEEATLVADDEEGTDLDEQL